MELGSVEGGSERREERVDGRKKKLLFFLKLMAKSGVENQRKSNENQ